jgi:hypothetical protein
LSFRDICQSNNKDNRKVLAEDLEIVAVIELVHWCGSVRGKAGGVNPRSCLLRGLRFISPSHSRRAGNISADTAALAGLIRGIPGWRKGFSCLERDVSGLKRNIAY